MTEHTSHPDYGDLDAYRTGEADAAVGEHVAGCNECRQTLLEIDEMAALVKAGSVLPPIPEIVERRILKSAHENAARVRREIRTARLQRWAIAAAVVLSVGGLVVWRQSRSAAPAQLDLVAATALVRQLAAAPTADGAYDVNHDGRADRADLEQIMHGLVALRDA